MPQRYSGYPQPAKAKPRGSRASKSVTMPAPVGGWNARDALTDMEPTDAVQLINFFPKQKTVTSRNGYVSSCNTASGVKIEMLVGFQLGTTTKRLACSGGKIYDATASSPTTLGSGYAGNLWVGAQMGAQMTLVNGTDAPVVYNGSTIAAHAWTASGLTYSNLNYALAFKSRMYFVEANTQHFWYGGVQAVQGALTKFDLSLVGSFKGNLIALATLPSGQGSYLTNFFVAIFSEGDVVVYSGSDPGVDFSLVGKFNIGIPLSPYAITTLGGDLMIATSRGYENLALSIASGEALASHQLISDKIQDAVLQAANLTGPRSDWRMAVFQPGQMFIVQVPYATASATYHVRNINTGAWCQFDLPNAYSWLVQQQSIYFGGRDGVVYQFNVGSTDNGTAIKQTAQLAWNYFNDRADVKHLKMLAFNLTSIATGSINVSVANDFGLFARWTTFARPSLITNVVWDVATWKTCSWPDVKKTTLYWHNFGIVGKALSLQMVALGPPSAIDWNSTTFILEQGGFLG